MGTKKLRLRGAILHISCTVFVFIVMLFVLMSLPGCRKDVLPEPAGFLSLQVGGEEDAIRWETITSKWDDSSGTLDLEASGYSFDHCSIHLKNIDAPIEIDSLSLQQFYYTDGKDFLPYTVSGNVVISEADHKSIRGTFHLYFSNNNSAVAGETITGSFAVVNSD